ncbi:hypothetical protein Ahy_B09g098466 [Arachis hypogaea]|uniref:Uncharacterized protein n=1 Tax=Arachis hypogaea TaxID=3818 RepID=A0A444XRE4_ARAHY|nr:hypothetical protein Ahy_B09g098466 [Arachis hypogaea]
MEASSSVVQDAWLWSGSRKILLTEEGDVADDDMQVCVTFNTVIPFPMECMIWELRQMKLLIPDQLINLEGVTVDDVLQMEFSTPEEASGFYNNYSRLKGFASRQGKKIRNSIGQIVRYTFVCNRQGFREKKWLEKMDRKMEHKVVTRCGCLAEMRIKKKDGTGNWYVSRFIDEHNHEMVSGKFVNYLRSHRKISEVEIAQLTSMRELGLVFQRYMNPLQHSLEVFGGVARVDGRMFWRYKVGSEEHLHDLFWSDGRSQDDYAVFGDVLAFDATYGRNKYNLPVVVFSGVNHHNQTCVFATVMVSCESQESYIWVLQQFLNCMQGKSPISVITDGDPAMRIAIQSVFPQAYHRLCAWHLLRNATQNICDPRFTQLLRHCMLANMETEEFEMHWQSMVDECGVVDVEWVKDLYRKKNSWATAYIRGRFFAGIRTTSRCESLHAKLGRFVESRYGVLEFVTNFQRCVDFLRDNEDELEFKSCYGTPVLQTEFVELEKSGWSKFTRDVLEISWAKTAKLTIGSGEETTDHAATYRSRLGAFSQICKRLGRVACMSDEDFKQYSKKLLSDAVVLEIKYGLRPTEPMVTSGLVRQGIKDPVRVRTKGTGRRSQAAPSVGKKRRKCSTCDRLGHRRTRCPNAPSQASLRPRDDFVLNRMTQEVKGGEKPVRTRKRKIGCDLSIVHQPIFSDSTTCIGECS